MAGADERGDVTRLLKELGREGGEAAQRLFPIVYEELRSLAAAQLKREKSGHTLQPTALVHEAYLKLAGRDEANYESRSHFLAVASVAMRRVLLHHAEKRGAQKRGGGHERRSVDTGPEVAAPDSGDPIDLLALDEALTRLAALDERKAKVVEMRYFAGLSVEETAEALGSSPATVKRDWDFARVWLLRELKRGETA